MKDSTDENDLVPDSIVYFYPTKDDFKRQKLLDCGEIVGLIQFFKHDLFACLPKEFAYKRSFVICEHFGRHSAFLVLPKDRFTFDEANVHLTHIIQLFNILYGTLNSIQSIHRENHQVQAYFKRTFTPLVEYVFNENRSIRSLFSGIDYASVKQDDIRFLLQIKHFLSHLESNYGVHGGFFAYDKQILYSSLDTETTFLLQVILNLEQNLPADEIHVPLNSETKLNNGVSLIRIHIRQAPSLQPMLNAVNTNNSSLFHRQHSSEPINILNTLFSNDNSTSPWTFQSNSMNGSSSIGEMLYSKSVITEESHTSSEEATDLDRDQSNHVSSSRKLLSQSAGSQFSGRKSLPVLQQHSKLESSVKFSPLLSQESRTDDDKIRHKFERSRSSMSDNDYDNSLKNDYDRSRFMDTNVNSLVFEPIETVDGHESSCCEDDMICLPPMVLSSHFHRPRQRTLTSYSDLNDGEYNAMEHQEGHASWGDVPEKNDEIERDELVLYIQRNSRMLFAGILEKDRLNEEYLRKLWYLMLTELANFDQEIRLTSTSKETNKYSNYVKFQFNENSHRTQFERFSYKTPSADSACMAFNARTKLHIDPERRMIGLTRGNNSVAINRVIPDRVTYYCPRSQEPR
ncbi:unnamed protein product [Adineta ricciae]|uniref:CCZ1/INTU/HSP4 first Longin domain-containing protein n=1 Tax=Adineta ricciae TaxID=249248 RepID=A0A813T139_ADIRI|nr:unnamed protein product [Adineta ricciae]CAF0804755.1 unnamed protein product [Adineta ricciae]